MGQIITQYVRPEPNPEMETRHRAWLKDIDGLLDIKWFPDVIPNQRHRTLEGRYAVICRWPQGDPRYAMIQTGEIGDTPYDILGWYTEDMSDGTGAGMSPEFMEQKVLSLLATADNQRTPWKQRLAQVAQHNIDLKAKRRQDFLDNQIHDIASHYRNEGLAIQQVSVPKQITND